MNIQCAKIDGEGFIMYFVLCVKLRGVGRMMLLAAMTFLYDNLVYSLAQHTAPHHIIEIILHTATSLRMCLWSDGAIPPCSHR